MPGQILEFDVGSYREPMDWDQAFCHILDRSSRLIPISSLIYIGIYMYPYRPHLLLAQVFFFLLGGCPRCRKPPIKHLPRVWFNSWRKCERKDLTELHLCWVICLCVCLFTASHSKLQLICIAWVNIAMNYSLWITAQEPLSIFLHLLPILKSPSC